MALNNPSNEVLAIVSITTNELFYPRHLAKIIMNHFKYIIQME